MDQNVNLAHKDCLRSISNIGETIVRNICDGSSTIIPWGTLDWLGFLFGGALGLALLAAIIGLVVVGARDLFW